MLTASLLHNFDRVSLAIVSSIAAGEVFKDILGSLVNFRVKNLIGILSEMFL